MTMKKLFTILVALVTVSGVFAQDYAFKVLANRGQNKVKKASGEELELKSGTLLMEDDVLITSEGAYIGLMHTSRKTLEVKYAGTHKVSDLLAKVGEKELSSIGRYTQFISKNLDDGESAPKRTVASRAVGDKITLMMPESVELYGDEAVIRWESSDKSESTYKFVVKDIVEEELYSIEVTGNSVRVNFAEIENDMGVNICQVMKIDDPDFASSPRMVKVVTSERSDVAADLEGVDLSGDSPLELLQMASYYDEKELFLDALTKYEEALELSPDVPEFQELYDIFLKSYGLKE